MRLEFASQVMIMVCPCNTTQSLSDSQLIAIFGAAFRNNVNPAQFGVVLTYALSTAISESSTRPSEWSYLLTCSLDQSGASVRYLRARDGESRLLLTYADGRTTPSESSTTPS